MMSLDDVQLRAKLWNDTYAYLDRFFGDRGYTNVRTPLVVRCPGMEPNLDPVGLDLHIGTSPAVLHSVDADGTRRYVREPSLTTHRAGLITSPEYAMKKLLGAGMDRIYTVTPVFRDKEYLHGEHGIEFTMLEWYRQNADYEACMDETEALVNGFLGWEGKWPRFSYVEEFELTFGVHPADLRSVAELGTILHDWKSVPMSDDLDEAIQFAFQTLVLPGIIGKNDRFFLKDFPIAEAALAQKTPDGRAAQRFEAYVHRMEMCNGFTELVNVDEQRARFTEEQKLREKLGKEVFPIDEELLSRLSSVASPTFGNALGVDRLVMLKAGVKNIDSIHLFPPSERFTS